MKFERFEEIQVWKESMDIVIEIYNKINIKK